MRRTDLLAALGIGTPAPPVGPWQGLLRARAALGQGLDDGTEGPLVPPGAGVVLPPGATVERDLAFGRSPDQRLDVYLPPAAQAAPIVLFVHGGGWHRGDKAMPQMVAHKMPHWVRQGCVFVSTNYRMLPGAPVLEQAADVARALAFVQGRATAWDADPARVIVVGHSAGAHLVALISADGRIAMDQGAQPWRASVALDSAALDMVQIMSGPHYRFYDPVFGSDPAFWREASPTHRLQGPPVVPMLMVGSTLREDSLPQAQAFADRARDLGGRVEVLPVALSHRDINDRLGLPGAYTEAVDAFLRSADGPGDSAPSPAEGR